MELTARLHAGESLADRILKVNHAGEHGAANIRPVVSATTEVVIWLGMRL